MKTNYLTKNYRALDVPCKRLELVSTLVKKIKSPKGGV